MAEEIATPTVPRTRGTLRRIHTVDDEATGAPEIRIGSPIPMTTYIKTVHRRGRVYMVRESLPSEEDPGIAEGTETQITDLHADTIKMSVTACRKANGYKTINILFNILVILGGAAVGILSINTENYVPAAIGFIITAIEAFQSTFGIERRAVMLKTVSGQLRTLAREIKALRTEDIKPKEKTRRLEDFYIKVDELDLAMFDNNVTGAGISRAEQRVANPTSSNDSDLISSDDGLYDDKSGNPKIEAPARAKRSRFRKKKQQQQRATVSSDSGESVEPIDELQ